jgi:hypothetical protein
MAAKQKYEIVSAGFLGGDYYAAGAIVELHPRQAEYDLPPFGTMLRPVGADATTEPKRAAKAAR